MSHVSIANTTPANTADAYAQNTRAGVMAYSSSTAYNGGITPSVTSSLDGLTTGSFLPYQTSDSAWRLKGNILNFPAGITNLQIGTAAGAVTPTVYDSYQQTDGKILVGGSFTTWNGVSRKNLVRLLPNGDVDTTFGTNIGTGPAISPGTSYIFSIIVQSDGKIIVQGNFTSWNGATRRGLVRLNSDGTEDASFGANFLAACTTLGPQVRLFFQSTGKLIGVMVNGNTSVFSSTVCQVFRLNTDGTRDTSFFLGVTCTGEIYQGLLCAAVDSSDNIYLAGDISSIVTAAGTITPNTSASYGGMVKLLPNGQNIDSTFKTNWSSSFSTSAFLTSNLPEIGNMGIDNTLNVLFFVDPAGVARKLNLSGVLLNTGSTFSPKPANDGEACVIQSDGKILVGGTFTTYNAITRNRLTRLNSDLTIDSTFATNLGTAMNNNVLSLKIVKYNDGILATGQFTSVNGTTKNGVAKILPTGTLQPTTGTTSCTLTINGATFLAAANQTVAISLGSSAPTTNDAVANTGQITTTSGSTITSLGASFDVALASKPTWAY